jgi:hypothetical protein
MLDQVLNGPDGWIVLKAIAILIPVLVFVWIVATVMALHRRDVYFWSLGSTWTSLIAGPTAIFIMSQSVWSRLHDPNAPLFMVPVMAGLMLYAVPRAYAGFLQFPNNKIGAACIRHVHAAAARGVGSDVHMAQVGRRP